LFSGDYGWMELFPLLIIELHDWLLPGQGTSHNFLKALTEFEFDVITRGENCFCFNNRILRAHAD
jgi:hypothetical protein